MQQQTELVTGLEAIVLDQGVRAVFAVDPRVVVVLDNIVPDLDPVATLLNADARVTVGIGEYGLQELPWNTNTVSLDLQARRIEGDSDSDKRSGHVWQRVANKLTPGKSESLAPLTDLHLGGINPQNAAAFILCGNYCPVTPGSGFEFQACSVSSDREVFNIHSGANDDLVIGIRFFDGRLNALARARSRTGVAVVTPLVHIVGFSHDLQRSNGQQRA